MAECNVSNCGRKLKAKGLCEKHYMRLRRTGRLDSSRQHSFDREEAFRLRVRRDTATGCLIWTGGKTKHGYGLMTRGGGRMVGAHRYAWERVNGPIPTGQNIDHICWNRACVELSHLRLADYSENGWNRSGPNPNGGTGVRNVHRHRGQYRVRVSKGGATYEGGVFSVLSDAADAAEALRADLFGEFSGRGA